MLTPNTEDGESLPGFKALGHFAKAHYIHSLLGSAPEGVRAMAWVGERLGISPSLADYTVRLLEIENNPILKQCIEEGIINISCARKIVSTMGAVRREIGLPDSDSEFQKVFLQSLADSMSLSSPEELSTQKHIVGEIIETALIATVESLVRRRVGSSEVGTVKFDARRAIASILGGKLMYKKIDEPALKDVTKFLKGAKENGEAVDIDDCDESSRGAVPGFALVEDNETLEAILELAPPGSLEKEIFDPDKLGQLEAVLGRPALYLLICIVKASDLNIALTADNIEHLTGLIGGERNLNFPPLVKKINSVLKTSNIQISSYCETVKKERIKFTAYFIDRPGQTQDKKRNRSLKERISPFVRGLHAPRAQILTAIAEKSECGVPTALSTLYLVDNLTALSICELVGLCEGLVMILKKDLAASRGVILENRLIKLFSRECAVYYMRNEDAQEPTDAQLSSSLLMDLFGDKISVSPQTRLRGDDIGFIKESEFEEDEILILKIIAERSTRGLKTSIYDIFGDEFCERQKDLAFRISLYRKVVKLLEKYNTRGNNNRSIEFKTGHLKFKNYDVDKEKSNRVNLFWFERVQTSRLRDDELAHLTADYEIESDDERLISRMGSCENMSMENFVLSQEQKIKEIFETSRQEVPVIYLSLRYLARAAALNIKLSSAQLAKVINHFEGTNLTVDNVAKSLRKAYINDNLRGDGIIEISLVISEKKEKDYFRFSVASHLAVQ